MLSPTRRFSPKWAIIYMLQVYFDFNATAPMRGVVIDAVNEVMAAGGNASSVHATGRAARATVEKARASVAALVGAERGWVIFCGSGTEADNQVLRCAGADTVLISAIEHEAVLLARSDAVRIPVGANGVIDLSLLEEALAASKGKTLISVMAANNETGVLQPMKEISRLARKYGSMFHTDAIQAAGKVSVDMAEWDVDFLSLSAHKIGGPQGVGALVARDRTLLNRFVHGGGQEGGLRAGTENVAGIAGFGAAAEAALDGLAEFGALAALRDRLEEALIAIEPSIEVFGADQARLPNTSKLATPGLTSETQVMGMDLAGYAISAGSACAAGRVEPPYVLTAMGVDDALSTCAVRISLGWTTTADEIDGFVAEWSKLHARNRGRSARAAG